MDVILDQSSEELLCCRVCLMTDCKLFNIHEYKLADTLSRISGTPIFKGRLPQYLCTYCHTLLLKCSKFRMLCLRTHHCLKKEVLKGELNTDRIRRMDRGTNRLLHLTLTEVENVDIPPSEKINDPNVDIGVPKIERVYKVESNTVSIDEDDTDDYETDSMDIEANMHTYNVNAHFVDMNEANIKSDEDEDIVEPNAVEIDKANIHSVNIDAPNIQKVGVVKQIIDKDMQETRFYSNTVERDEANIHSVNITDAPNIQKVGVVKQIIDKDMQETRFYSNTVERDEANIHSVNITDAPNIQKVGVVKQIIDKDTQETRFNTVNIATIKKPELKMELEILKGQLKIKVVKDATNVKTIPALKRPRSEMEASKVKVKKVSSVAKRMKTGKENNKSAVKRVRNKNVPGMVNAALVRKLNRETGVKRKRLYFPKDPANNYLQEFDYSKFERDHAVKIVTLSKQEQVEEIAARKQSSNYTTARFPCEDCGKGFNMEPAYNNHRRRHSPSAGEYSCEICSVRFKKRSHRQGHLDTHRLKFTCERCPFVSRTKHQAKCHYEMHDGKIFKCQHCEKTYSKQSTYFSHVRMSHPTANAACDLCGETYIGERGVYVHKQLVHKHAQTPQQFKCFACSATFLSAYALKTHADLGEHAGRACEQCGESCASEEALREHVRVRHPPEAHTCEECNVTFSSAAAFDVHKRRKHLNERYAERPGRWKKYGTRREKPARPYMCEQCGKLLPSAGLLRDHQNGHLAVKPYPCPHCPKTFANAALLRDHQNGHLAVKPYPCPHCPKTFATKYWRNEHLRIHTGEKPHQCDQCPRAFRSRSNMIRHYKVVHLGQHDNAACSACPRVCTTRASLDMHFRAVHLRQGWPKRPNRKRPARKPAPARKPEPARKPARKRTPSSSSSSSS